MLESSRPKVCFNLTMSSYAVLQAAGSRNVVSYVVLQVAGSRQVAKQVATEVSLRILAPSVGVEREPAVFRAQTTAMEFIAFWG